MLHRADALYTTGRSDVLLKMKLWHDASATRLLVSGLARRPGDHLGGLEPALCSLDISVPTAPVIAGCAQGAPRPSGPTAWALDPDGRHLYVANNGLTVLRFDVP